MCVYSVSKEGGAVNVSVDRVRWGMKTCVSPDVRGCILCGCSVPGAGAVVL